jgi:hypothetical protein
LGAALRHFSSVLLVCLGTPYALLLSGLIADLCAPQLPDVRFYRLRVNKGIDDRFGLLVNAAAVDGAIN